MLHRHSVRFATSDVAEDGTFSGYGSVFGVVDTYGDIVVPGAYKATLAEHASNGTRPKGLWQHDPNQPILSWQELREDDKGLFCKGKLILEVQRAREAHALLKAGEIDGLSIGFEIGDHETVDADQVETRFGLVPMWGPGGCAGRVRMVRSLVLWEVSLVTFPSNPAARVGAVKSKPRDLAPLIAAIGRRQAALAALA